MNNNFVIVKFITLVFSTLPLFLLAQTEKGTGLIWEDKTFNAFPRVFKSDTNQLKLPTKLSLKTWSPYPADQGETETCTTWAVAYAAYSIQKAIQTNLQNRDSITKYAYSAMYLYLQLAPEADCEEGLALSFVLSALKNKGDIYHCEFGQALCGVSPHDSLGIKASANRIKNYASLFSPFESNLSLKNQLVKESLAQKKPVIVGMEISLGFKKIPYGTKYWNTTLDSDYAGGHALCVVGYDDDKQAFEVMNSWGREWANEGFIWIKYNDFARYVRYAVNLDLYQGY